VPGQRGGYAELLEVAQGYNGSASGEIMLGAGEAVFYEVTGTALIEERRGKGQYQGRSSGSRSLSAASLAAQCATTRVLPGGTSCKALRYPRLLIRERCISPVRG
jgi:hypothetical protein